jgi:hypothetical protein
LIDSNLLWFFCKEVFIVVQHCPAASAWGNYKVILFPDELVVGCQPVACNLLRGIMMTGIIGGLATTGL